ncbi:MAG: efflux transporter outer membrane subunit [Opitutales bacterium]
MVALGAAWLGGCQVQSGPAPEPRAAVPVPDSGFAAAEKRVPPEDSDGVGYTLAGQVDSGWLDDFNSPALIALVEEALQNNPSLAVAAANVDRSQAVARQAGAVLKPQLAAGLGNTQTVTSASRGANTNTFGASLEVSWEIDIWGKHRSQQEAAVLEALATEEDFFFARESLAAQVSKAYFLAIGLRLQKELSEAILESNDETVRVVRARVEAGEVDRGDLLFAQSERDTAASELLEAEGAYNDALRSLEVLLGRYPSSDVEVAADLPQLSGPVPAGLPSQMLERRPDLIAAERRVASAFNATNAARAARLPSLSLTASGGGSSESLGSLLNPYNLAGNFGANLLGPLFDGGFLKAGEEIARADQRVAFEGYRAAALTAFQDAETSIDNEYLFAEREKALAQSSANIQEAFNIIRSQYEAGEADILDFLIRQRTVAQVQGAFLAIRQGRLAERVNLYLALGGSFEAPEPEADEPAAATAQLSNSR